MFAKICAKASPLNIFKNILHLVILFGFLSPILITNKARAEINVTLGGGISSLTYTEAARGTISQTARAVKLSIDNRLNSGGLSFGGNGYSTLAVTSKSTASSVQMSGANFRIGYLTPWLRSRWMLGFFSGLYYTTTSGGTGDFGYSNLAGPQVFSTLAYRFQSGAVLGGYVKYSPIANGLKLYDLQNNEASAGLSYFISPLRSSFLRGMSLGITADLSKISLNAALLGNVTFQTKTFGLAIRF